MEVIFQKRTIIFLSLVALLLVTGCADSNDVRECLTGHTYGFWGGLWHGIIAPFAFVGSLINSDIVVWAPNNNGGWYAFGFLIGTGSLFSFGTKSSSKS